MADETEEVVFLSKRRELKVDRPSEFRKEMVGGQVVERPVYRPHIEFSNHKYITDDPDEIEYLRNHGLYTPPGEPLSGIKASFTELAEDEASDAEPEYEIDGEPVTQEEYIRHLEEQVEGGEAETSDELRPEDVPDDAPETPEVGSEAEAPAASDLYPIEGVSNKQEAVEALAEYTGKDATDLPSASDTKQAILEVAHDEGYYFHGYED